MDEIYVYEQVSRLSNIACQRMNEFSSRILKTRGGRIGSGMGALLDSFFDRAKGIAMLRDALHIARGGSFVGSEYCPDGCQSDYCVHIGEPLNAEGKRELRNKNRLLPALLFHILMRYC